MTAYTAQYDKSTGGWQDVQIHGIVRLYNKEPVLLKETIVIKDAPGSSWIRDQNLRVVSAKLALSKKVADITLQFSPSFNLTLQEYEAVLEGKFTVPVVVTLVPDLQIAAPGVLVPLAVGAAITQEATVILSGIPPPEIEYDEDRESGASRGAEVSELEARVVLPRGVSLNESEKETIRRSIGFHPENNAIQVVDESDTVGGRRGVFSWGATSSVNANLLKDGAMNRIRIDARVGKIPVVTTAQITITPVEVYLDVTADKTTLKLDGNDSLPVYARVIFKDATSDADPRLHEVRESLNINIDGSAATWITPSARSIYGNDVAGWNLSARKFDSTSAPGKQSPTDATVSVTGMWKGVRVSGKKVNIRITETARGVLKVDPAQVEVCRGDRDGNAGIVKAWVEEPGAEKWVIDGVFSSDTPDPPKVETVVQENCKATLMISAPSRSDSPSREPERKLTVRARSGNVTLEQEVTVNVGSEGLFVSREGIDTFDQYRLLADGKSRTPVHFEVWSWDGNHIENDTDLVTRLVFDDQTDEEEGVKAAEVGNLKHECQGLSGIETKQGRYEFHFEHEVPGIGETYPLTLEVSVPDRVGEEFRKKFTIALITTKEGPSSPRWEEEYDNITEIIDRFVPPKYRRDFHAIVDRQKMTLGAEGMYILRHKIWEAAQNLTLGDDSVRNGYLNEAAAANRTVKLLEWVDWLSDAIVRAYFKMQDTVDRGNRELRYRIAKIAIVSILRYFDAFGGVAGIPKGNDDWFWKDTVPQLIRIGVGESIKYTIPDRNAELKWLYNFIWFLNQFLSRMAFQKQSWRKALEGAFWAALQRTYIENQLWLRNMLLEKCPSLTIPGLTD